jgi:hypothetical protein
MTMTMNRREFVKVTGAAVAMGLARVGNVFGAGDEAFDVVVYGGVPCGIAAAIAAARGGAKVLLIEPTKHIGGLNTSGINTAETEHMLKWTIGGIALEFYQKLGERYGMNGKPAFYFDSSGAEKTFLAMLSEAGVAIRFGARVEKVEKSGGRISRIALGDGSTVAAKVFVDAGYEGDLMARAGVMYTFGRESRDEFGEEAAGVRLDKTPRRAATVDEKGNLLPGISAWAKDLTEGSSHRGVMNYNYRLTFAKDPEKRVPVPAPQHYDRARFRLLENWLREKSAQKQPVKLTDILDIYSHAPDKTKKELNNKQDAIISLGHFGGQFDYPDGDYATRERILADHWDYTLGLLKFLADDESTPENVRAEMKSWGLHKDEFADNGNLPYQVYVREARRMRGAFVVTQRDVQDDRRKPDSIGIASHFIDCHHVQRVALSPTEFVNEGRIWRPGAAYQVPYRAITPKQNECENLLVPGAASYSHVAYCTYRLESVWMIGGHAAGTAAALAMKSSAPVQSLDVAALQEKLRAEKQVVDFVADQPEQQKAGGGYKEF